MSEKTRWESATCGKDIRLEDLLYFLSDPLTRVEGAERFSWCGGVYMSGPVIDVVPKALQALSFEAFVGPPRATLQRIASNGMAEGKLFVRETVLSLDQQH